MQLMHKIDRFKVKRYILLICLFFLSPHFLFAQEKNGVVKRYYPNGALMSEATFKNGKLHGISKNYDENGKIVREFVYEEGIQIMSDRQFPSWMFDPVNVRVRLKYHGNKILETGVLQLRKSRDMFLLLNCIKDNNPCEKSFSINRFSQVKETTYEVVFYDFPYDYHGEITKNRVGSGYKINLKATVNVPCKGTCHGTSYLENV